MLLFGRKKVFSNQETFFSEGNWFPQTCLEKNLFLVIIIVFPLSYGIGQLVSSLVLIGVWIDLGPGLLTLLSPAVQRSVARTCCYHCPYSTHSAQIPWVHALWMGKRGLGVTLLALLGCSLLFSSLPCHLLGEVFMLLLVYSIAKISPVVQ